MNKKAQLELDIETMASGGLGLLCGMLAVYVMKGAGLGVVWKIITFVASSAAGAVLSYLILTK